MIDKSFILEVINIMSIFIILYMFINIANTTNTANKIVYIRNMTEILVVKLMYIVLVSAIYRFCF